jgi:hypothetical protein
MVQSLTSSVARSADKRTNQSAYIIEKLGTGSDDEKVPCGAAIVNDCCPDYLLDNEEMRGKLAGLSNYLYLNVLVTHKGAAFQARGAGDALIEHVKSVARLRGNETVFVDCWDGNDGALIK